jgi:hypothetical protein
MPPSIAWYGQVVLTALGEPPRVMSEVPLRVADVQSESLGDLRVHPPATGEDVVGGHERERRGMIAVLVDEPDRVEHLHRVVGIEARQDLRDLAEVPVDELAQAPVVVDCAGTRASPDEELELRDAERVLGVDGEKT